MTPILTVTLNPALDVATSVDALEPQRKLRCAPPRYEPGGGGVNVSRAIKELGGDSRAFVVLAGATGERYARLLDEIGLEYRAWQGPDETRTTFHVTERSSGRLYRFVLPGPEHAPDEEPRLAEAVRAEIAATGCRFVVASGSAPPGLAPEVFAKIAAAARDANAKLVLDTSGPAFAAALAERPFLVRADRYEAEAMLGGAELTEEAARDLAEDLLARKAAEVVIITFGSEGALVATDGAGWRIRPPEVEVVSSVGAGDSFIGALALGLARGWPLEDAGRYGVAAAASAVTTEATQLCRRHQTDSFFGEIAGAVEKIGLATTRRDGS